MTNPLNQSIMKNQIKSGLLKIFAGMIMASVFWGCGEMLDNPLIDKETGEEVNLLIVDFNFFDTRMTYKLVDASDRSVIRSAANIYFTGQNGNDIVNFAGEKKSSFSTQQGQLELTVDPNVPITESTPLEYAVNVEVDGYHKFSQGIRIHSKGKKTFELLLSKISDDEQSELNGNIDTDNDTVFVFGSAHTATKSASIIEEQYKIVHTMTLADILKCKNGDKPIFASKAEALSAYQNDPANFAKMTFMTHDNFPRSIELVEGYDKSLLFQKLETGRLAKFELAGVEVTSLGGGQIRSSGTFTGQPLPDIVGFTEFAEDRWMFLGESVSHNKVDFTYTFASASEEALCGTGSSIRFASNAQSSFSIDGDIYDSNNRLIKTMNFKGSFPETFILENVPPVAGKIVFRDNNPSFKPIGVLEIADLCSGTYEVDVEPAEGYIGYQVVLKAFCPDNPAVAVAPTYSGEMRIKNSDHPWQGIDMEGGVADVLVLPRQEYEIRLLWENQWETTSFRTEPGNFSNGLNSSKVEYYETEDGRIKVSIEHVFEQDICNDMGW